MPNGRLSCSAGRHIDHRTMLAARSSLHTFGQPGRHQPRFPSKALNGSIAK